MSGDFQVPVFLRQYVSAISAVPGKGASAYTVTSRIVLFNLVSFDTVVHESTHAQDWGSNNHTYGSRAWDDAIAEDSCVADAYAQRNNVEAYAQAMVTFLYKLLLLQDATISGNAIDCMSHQLEFINNSQAPGLQDFIKVRGCHVSCCMKRQEYTFWPSCFDKPSITSGCSVLHALMMEICLVLILVCVSGSAQLCQ